MRKLLVVGAGTDQVPAIQLAQSMGYYVVASDRSPDAPGLALANAAEIASTADLDATLAVARRHGIDGVLTLCSETAVKVIAAVAARLKLPAISERTAHLATNKNAMKAVMCAAGVPVPRWIDTVSCEDALELGRSTCSPYVVKPSDNSGQRGVTFVTDDSLVVPAITEARSLATDGRVTVEEFVPGPELNTIVIAHGGDVRLISVSERVTVPPPSFGIAVEHVAPACIPDHSLADVTQVALAATRALGMAEGIAYPQIVAGPRGARLIEIAARIPGGHMRETAMHLSGIDPVRVAILQAMREEFTWENVRTEPAHDAVTVKFLTARDVPENSGVLVAVENLDAARAVPGVQLAYVGLSPGSPIPALRSSGARFGAVIAVGESRDQSYERATRAHGLIRLLTTARSG